MQTLTVECDVHFDFRGKGARKDLRSGEKPKRMAVPGRVPRVARLLALAHRFEQLVRAGQVDDYASLARLGRVTRARITQIMNLLCLAPDIQEHILFLPRTLHGRDPIRLRQLQTIAKMLDWSEQRRMWRELQAAT